MLKEILKAFKTKSPVTEMLDEFSQMMEKGEWMFGASIQVLSGERNAKEAGENLRAEDEKVNELERSIRRKVLTHLILQPGTDVPLCVLLISLIKDAERIADYCKNICELGYVLPPASEENSYAASLTELAGEVKGLFDFSRRGFTQSDREMANLVIERGKLSKSKCDTLVRQLVEETSLVEKAVAYALLARFFKRIAGHLVNIATAVVKPVDSLDYSDKS